MKTISASMLVTAVVSIFATSVMPAIKNYDMTTKALVFFGYWISAGFIGISLLVGSSLGFDPSQVGATNANAFDSVRDASQRKCGVCDESGHDARNCSRTVRCSYCNISQHNIRTCLVYMKKHGHFYRG